MSDTALSGPAAVTGATGFIGTHLVERLVDDGVPVRAMVRSPSRMAPELRARVEVVVGTLEEPAALRRLMDGAATVFHLAGLASAWTRSTDDFFTVNVEGTRRVLAAAGEAGVPRVVHVSTVLTRFAVDEAPTPYVASKHIGEHLAQRYVRDGGDAVIVQPTRVYGPGPLNDANGATRLVDAYLHAPVCVRLRDGGVRASWVHVDDVVQGMILAARRGEIGEAYVLGAENASVAELLGLTGELAGARRRCIAVPPAVALVIAGALELGGRLGLPVPITRSWVRSFLQDQTVDIAPTRQALGYHPHSLRQGLARTIEWLRERKDGG